MSQQEEITATISNVVIWKTKDILLLFYCIFGIYIKFAAFPKKKKKKKNELHSLSISEISDSERCGC